MQGSGKINRNFAKAKEFFVKSLQADSKDAYANYQLGVMSMLGLGCDPDMEKAIEYFEQAGDDAQAKNALGVIYYNAPDVLETSEQLFTKQKYGKVRKNLKKAVEYLETASQKGNINAKYNLGVMCLDSSSEKFSYSKAYEYFKYGASKGHIMSSYNLGLMSYLGLGTYKSQRLALTFLKHVVSVGEYSQLFKKAYNLVSDGKTL